MNLHNALLVEGVVEEGVTRTVRDSRGFQDRARRLGGQQVNARDLAYGLLGGNVRPPYRLRRPFAASDPRAAWVVDPPDPRARIALIDGTRSGPPLHAYDPHPEALEEGLHAATVAFVNDTGGVMGCPGAGWYGLSPLFTWNARHFGGPAGVREFVASHVASPVFAEGIRSGALKMRLLDYDWGLNKCVVEGSS